MPGRIGKSYPRFQSAQQTPPPPQGRARRYAALGSFIALLSALGVVGWLIFR